MYAGPLICIHVIILIFNKMHIIPFTYNVRNNETPYTYMMKT